jgi:hypothetical protein
LTYFFCIVASPLMYKGISFSARLYCN